MCFHSLRPASRTVAFSRHGCDPHGVLGVRLQASNIKLLRGAICHIEAQRFVYEIAGFVDFCKMSFVNVVQSRVLAKVPWTWI